MTPEEVEGRFQSLTPSRPPERLRERCLSAPEGSGDASPSALERPEKPKGLPGRLLAVSAAAGFLAFALWLGGWRIAGRGATPTQESPEDREKQEVRARVEATREIARRLEEAYRAFSRKDFDRTLRLSRDILQIDPNYIVARELLEDAEESRKNEAYFQIAGKKVDQWKNLTNSEAGIIPWSQTVRFPSSKEWAELFKGLQEGDSKKGSNPQDESLHDLTITVQRITKKKILWTEELGLRNRRVHLVNDNPLTEDPEALFRVYQSALQASNLMLVPVGREGEEIYRIESSPQVPKQDKDSTTEVVRLISDLASDAPGDREAARKRLLALGSRALDELDRALYDDNANIRVKAAELSREIREHLAYDPVVPFVRAAVAIVRKNWRSRDFAKIEAMVEEAFSPMGLRGFPHYVPRRVVEDPSRDLASVMAPNGTGEDFLSKAVFEELEKEPGMVFLEFADEPKDDKARIGGTFGSWGTLFFTLPDRQGWSAYVVVDLPSPAVFQERNCTVQTLWGRWTKFGATVRLESLANVIVVTDAGAADFWRPEEALLKAGDIVREVNGKAELKIGDVRALFENPPEATQEAGGGRTAGRDLRRITVERNGKIFVARVHLIVP